MMKNCFLQLASACMYRHKDCTASAWSDAATSQQDQVESGSAIRTTHCLVSMYRSGSSQQSMSSNYQGWLAEIVTLVPYCAAFPLCQPNAGWKVACSQRHEIAEIGAWTASNYTSTCSIIQIDVQVFFESLCCVTEESRMRCWHSIVAFGETICSVLYANASLHLKHCSRCDTQKWSQLAY